MKRTLSILPESNASTLKGFGKLEILYVPPLVIATTEVFAPVGSLNCNPLIVAEQPVVYERQILVGITEPGPA